eukprot:TRINITY_DN5493_c1_g1_i4.p1 TRINITY_DN5493_c1_g1~~TRINITY_DN5493_c1_g1_i4.p1  ORF type:complete len:1171 (+),score=322.57 TRINITY_DN5493_c1_g1_i4:927-4439(+)
MLQVEMRDDRGHTLAIPRKRMCFLMNDMLILKGASAYSAKFATRTLPLLSAFLVDSDMGGLGFVLCTKDMSYHLAADTMADKVKWMKLINECLLYFDQSSQKTIRDQFELVKTGKSFRVRVADHVELGKGQGPKLLDEEEPFTSARATFNFTPSEAEIEQEALLPLKKGSHVFVFRQHDTGWWEGESEGKYGYFPCSFVQLDANKDNKDQEGTTKQEKQGLESVAATEPKETAPAIKEGEPKDTSPGDSTASPVTSREYRRSVRNSLWLRPVQEIAATTEVEGDEGDSSAELGPSHPLIVPNHHPQNAPVRAPLTVPEQTSSLLFSVPELPSVVMPLPPSQPPPPPPTTSPKPSPSPVSGIIRTSSPSTRGKPAAASARGKPAATTKRASGERPGSGRFIITNDGAGMGVARRDRGERHSGLVQRLMNELRAKDEKIQQLSEENMALQREVAALKKAASVGPSPSQPLTATSSAASFFGSGIASLIGGGRSEGRPPQNKLGRSSSVSSEMPTRSTVAKPLPPVKPNGAPTPIITSTPPLSAAPTLPAVTNATVKHSPQLLSSSSSSSSSSLPSPSPAPSASLTAPPSPSLPASPSHRPLPVPPARKSGPLPEITSPGPLIVDPVSPVTPPPSSSNREASAIALATTSPAPNVNSTSTLSNATPTTTAPPTSALPTPPSSTPASSQPTSPPPTRAAAVPPPPAEDNMCFVYDGPSSVWLVKGGSVEALIECLYDKEVPKGLSDYIHVFLLTYRSFTDGPKVFHTVTTAYHDNLNSGEPGRRTRLRVVNFLRRWIEGFFHDFTTYTYTYPLPTAPALPATPNAPDTPPRPISMAIAAHHVASDTPPTLLDALQRFILLVKRTDNNQGGILEKALQRGKQGRRDRAIVFAGPPPLPLFSSSSSSSSPLLGGPSSTSLSSSMSQGALTLSPLAQRITVLDLDPKEVARQIALVEFDIYKAIHPKEFLSLSWQSKDKQVRSPNLLRMIQRFNQVSAWVVMSVMREVDLRRRTSVLARFVDICEECLTLNNFNALFELCSGLQAAAMHRLKKTWEASGRQKKFERMLEKTAPNSSYAVIRSLLHNSNPPLIPYLGVYMTDLTFIEEGNPDKLENGWVNYSKCRMVADVIQEIQQYQNTPPNLTPVPAIQNWLQQQLSQEFNLNNCYKASLLVEPRE